MGEQVLKSEYELMVKRNTERDKRVEPLRKKIKIFPKFQKKAKKLPQHQSYCSIFFCNYYNRKQNIAVKY